VRRTLAYLGKQLDPATPTGENSKKAPSARVSGPYYDANVGSYRLVVFDGTKRKSVRAQTESEALKLKAELEQALQQSDRTIGSALSEFIQVNRKRGLKEISLKNLEYKLSCFLPLGKTLCSLTAEQAQTLYEAETEKKSRFGHPMRAMTHHYVLRQAKRFFKWACEQGYTRLNPFEKVRPIGKPNVGKDQLRIDEARQFTDVLVTDAKEGKLGAIAVLTQLMLGLRTSEVLERQVRDLDDGGRVFWVPSGKTKNARRRLDVPAVLQPILVKLAQGRQPDGLLFPGSRGQRRPNTWLWVQVTTYCERAGLRRVCPHSLRGLHSSLAIASGCTSVAVASALGHGSFGVTAKHYVDPDTLRNTKARQVVDTLAGEALDEVSRLAQRLSQISPSMRASLLRALDETA
jgi:integrase